MKHVMVDLETLSSEPAAAIVSIGAVQFDLEASVLGTRFFTNVIPDPRLHISGDTVMWWMEQSDAARASLKREPRMAVASALEMFSLWYPKGASLWGNGATFDNVILRNAYRVTGQKAPWHYRDDRCFRTMRDMLPRVEWPVRETAHDALCDAVAQAQYLVAAWAAAKK